MPHLHWIDKGFDNWDVEIYRFDGFRFYLNFLAVWRFWMMVMFFSITIQVIFLNKGQIVYALAIRMYRIRNLLSRALERKVLPISTRTLRMMFSLSFVGGSKSVSRFGRGGVPHPPADLDRRVQI